MEGKWLIFKDTELHSFVSRNQSLKSCKAAKVEREASWTCPEALGSLYVCRFGIGFGVCPKGRTDEKRLFSPNVCDDAGKVLRNMTKAGNILFQKCGFSYSHKNASAPKKLVTIWRAFQVVAFVDTMEGMNVCLHAFVFYQNLCGFYSPILPLKVLNAPANAALLQYHLHFITPLETRAKILPRWQAVQAVKI